MRYDARDEKKTSHAAMDISTGYWIFLLAKRLVKNSGFPMVPVNFLIIFNQMRGQVL